MGKPKGSSRGGNQISQFQDGSDHGVGYYGANPTSLISFEICDRDRTSSQVVIPEF